jgi:hypothetical protein
MAIKLNPITKIKRQNEEAQEEIYAELINLVEKGETGDYEADQLRSLEHEASHNHEKGHNEYDEDGHLEHGEDHKSHEDKHGDHHEGGHAQHH